MAVVTPALLDLCAPHVGGVQDVEELAGGNVSHVYRVRGPRGVVILKVRGSWFARIPDVPTDPALIGVERAALAVFGAAVPDVFPEVLEFDEERHALVLSEIFPAGGSFEDALRLGPATPAQARRLGEVLGDVHAATRSITTPIRPDGDLAFRDHQLWYCLESSGHPALLECSAHLKSLPDNDLVLGDVAPKNMSVSADRVAICDLDTVHRGSHWYDVTFVLAHLLLHHLRAPKAFRPLSAEFLAGYRSRNSLPELAASIRTRLVIGFCLYRLVNELVPYRLELNAAQRAAWRERFLVVLDRSNPEVS
ncbi:phosphotransferase family protein [Lentzea sp. E54]|uniref:phosphotransferase family protein n=1 Tax=Lentzea xerophila TaxID=3435883 RepID=UPI003DA35435